MLQIMSTIVDKMGQGQKASASTIDFKNNQNAVIFAPLFEEIRNSSEIDYSKLKFLLKKILLDENKIPSEHYSWQEYMIQDEDEDEEEDDTYAVPRIPEEDDVVYLPENHRTIMKDTELFKASELAVSQIGLPGFEKLYS